MTLLLRRRTFLRLIGAGGAAVSVPWLPGCSDRSSEGAAAGGKVARFFTPEEREIAEQLAGAILPEDQTVGAIGANAVEYIDRFLAAFDNPLPDIYRSGPDSGRWPYPDPETGAASDDFPDDEFDVVLPLSRMQDLAFRIELLGSASVPNGDINAPLVDPTPGLQTLYRDGLADLERRALERGADGFGGLTPDERLDVFRTSPTAFRDAVLANLCEGMFSAPEYGGNRDGVAWRDFFYDGDSQPLGHTLYSAQTDSLFDRADQPNQSLDPNLPNAGLEPGVERFVDTITRGQGGKRYF